MLEDATRRLKNSPLAPIEIIVEGINDIVINENHPSISPATLNVIRREPEILKRRDGEVIHVPMSVAVEQGHGVDVALANVEIDPEARSEYFNLLFYPMI